MESGKYEGDDRKKCKAESKESGFLPASKLIENKTKVNSKKTKEIFNEFPNFTALTEEERLAFFEILNAARKNVEDTENSLGSKLFDSPQDEFLQYFNGNSFQRKEMKKVSSHSTPVYSSTCTLDEDSQEQPNLRNSAFDLSKNFDSDDLFLLDKSFKSDSASLASLSVGQSVVEKESYPKCAKSSSLSKKNSSCTEIESWDERQSFFNAENQNKIANYYLKSKKLTEKKNEPNQKSKKSPPSIESTGNEDNWSDKTYDVPPRNFDSEAVPSKKKKREKHVRGGGGRGSSVKATPKFDSLTAEEKEIFFNVLQEAHENVLQKNMQNESEVLPLESIIRNYRMETNKFANYNEISLDSQTLRFPRDDGGNIKVKVTLTSTDNQRLEKEREGDKDKPDKMELLKDTKKTEDASKEDLKKDGESDSTLESCDSNEKPEEVTDKEEMARLYNKKKKLMESKIKLTMEDKKKNEDNCSLDEKEKVVVANKESKEVKSAEVKDSHPEKQEGKSLQKKPSEPKINDSSEWVSSPERERSTTKKPQSEKKFLGFSRNRKEGKDKDVESKNAENEERTSLNKGEKGKDKDSTLKNVETDERSSLIKLEKGKDKDFPLKNTDNADRISVTKSEKGKDKDFEFKNLENEKGKDKEFLSKNIENEGRTSATKGEKIKEKDFSNKNAEKEERISSTKGDAKKDKDVVEVESVSVHEFKKNKMDPKSGNSVSQKSLKISQGSLSQAENSKQKVSVYRNETIEEDQNIENEETAKVKEEAEIEIKTKDSTSKEKRSQKESEENCIEPDFPTEKDLSERQEELKLMSNKVITVSREGQQSVKTSKLLEGNLSQNERDRSRDSPGKENKYDQEAENYEDDKNNEQNFKEGDFKCGKVVLVDDGVIEKIKQLIIDLEKNAKAEEDSLSNDYVQLLLEYISYLSKVLCALVNKRDKDGDLDVIQVQTSLNSPNPHLKFEEKGKRKCKQKPKIKREEDETLNHPLSVSATSLNVKKTKLEKKSSLLSTGSEGASEDESLWAPMFVKQKILPSTKIRLLQDLLKERAKFVEGSISEFKVVKLPEKDYVPTEKPILRLNLEDEEDAFVEKGTKFNFFKALFKFCRCGKKETGDENNILENLKGEAVAVDTSESQAKNPASATINDSTMEVLKAAERKKIIQKYWKYNS